MDLIEILRGEHPCNGCVKRNSNECLVCHFGNGFPSKKKLEDLYRTKPTIEKAAEYYADYESIEKSRTIEEHRQWLVEVKGFELSEKSLKDGKVEMRAHKDKGGSIGGQGEDRLTAIINLVSYIKKHGRF